MVSLLGELHFLSLRNDIVIKDSDVGCHIYHEKGASAQGTEQPYTEDKHAYSEARGQAWTLKNKKPERLRDGLKELEELLLSQRCVHSEWKSSDLLLMVLSGGSLIWVTVSAYSGGLERILVDRTLEGRLHSEHIVDVVVSDNFLVFSYVEPKLTFIQLNRNLTVTEVGSKGGKLNSLEPKVLMVDLHGPVGRRLERRLSCGLNKDLVVVWWRISADEIWPWTPKSTDRERANMFVFLSVGSRMDLVCYYRTEGYPLLVKMSEVNSHQIHTVEVKFGKKGEFNVDRCVYEMTRNKMQRVTVTTIQLKSAVTCCQFNHTEDKLALGLEDSSLVIHDENKQLTQMNKIAFIPTMIKWEAGNTVLLVGNERGQLQCFDTALSCVKLQLLAEDPAPARYIDVSLYFRYQPTLQQLLWNPLECSQTNINCLLLFNKGPLCLLQFYLGAFSQGKLSPVELVSQYIKCRQFDEAVNLVTCLNWNTQGDTTLSCLTLVINHLLRVPLNLDREAQLEASLGSFYSPTCQLSELTIFTYREAVCHLARRFFHHLLRYLRFEKAFLLAVDLGSRDLFMDIHYLAADRGETFLAEAARKKAEELDLGSVSVTDSAGSQDELDDSYSTEGSDSSASSDSDQSEARIDDVKQLSRDVEQLTVRDDVAPPLPPRKQPPLSAGMTQGALPTVVATPVRQPPPAHSYPWLACAVPESRQIKKAEIVPNITGGVTMSPRMPDFTSNSRPEVDPVALESAVATRTPGQPGDSSEEDDDGTGTIKVIHFGVV